MVPLLRSSSRPVLVDFFEPLGGVLDSGPPITPNLEEPLQSVWVLALDPGALSPDVRLSSLPPGLLLLLRFSPLAALA